jgi:phage gpG-like protein
MSRKGNFDFKEKLEEFKKFKQTAPRAVGEITANFFQDNFTKQGFDDNGVNPWTNVQRRMSGTDAYKYPKKKDLGRRTRAILVKSGRMRRDIRVRQATWNRTTIATMVKYASYHNEGTKNIPKRKFMGHSRSLERKQKAYLINKSDAILGR